MSLKGIIVGRHSVAAPSFGLRLVRKTGGHGVPPLHPYTPTIKKLSDARLRGGGLDGDGAAQIFQGLLEFVAPAHA